MILLRKLTLKSIASFYYDQKEMTVEMLIKDKPYEVLKAYYNLEKITFNEDVLNILKQSFISFYEITKPGIDKDYKSKIFGQQNYDTKSYEDLKLISRRILFKGGMISNSLKNALKQKKLANQLTEDNINVLQSKSLLMSKNHGH